MAHPAWFALTIGIAVGAAIFAYFVNSSANEPHRNNTRNRKSRPFYDESQPKNPGQNIQCTICLDEIPGSRVKRLKCNHIFHEKCIVQWLRTSDQCPNCRQRI